jgi:pSer/pThr/pTyr-binding forkhead associated (FHA) protein
VTQTLVFTHGPLAGRRIRLQRDDVTLGRRTTNDIVLEDPLVSRLHALVTRRGGGMLIEDLGSHNGTYVNGERVMGLRQIQQGDLIQVGSSRAYFEDDSLIAEDTTNIMEAGVLTGTQTFTQRQLQVVRLAARGLANKEIARRLYVSERTVKAYLSSVFDKLGVNNRSAAIMAALRLGLIDMPAGDEDQPEPR